MRIPIVNEEDEVVKVIDINERQTGEICRVTGLWLTDPDGNILLAQRAFTKRKSPGLWGPAVAGTVEEGETYESNIIKESEEEIGLYGIKPKQEHKVRGSTTHEYFCQWFSLMIDPTTKLTKQDEEVETLQWFTKEEVIKFFEQNPEKFVPSFNRTMKAFIV